MIDIRAALAPVLLLSCLISPVRARAAEAPVVHIERDVVYGDDPRLQALDVYRPAHAIGALPLLVFIHGGGWSEGDKGPHIRKGTFFARQGFVYACVNYRLSPAVQHPAHVQDVAKAIAWLYRNADRIGADRSRIFLVGHSAGAHLAALVATDPRRLGAEGLSPDIIDGVVLLDGGGYDLVTRVPKARGWSRTMLRNAFGDDPAVWHDASPVRHLAEAAVPPPPFLIFHVTSRPSSIRQASRLAAAVRAAGGEAIVVAVSDRNHATIARQLGLKGDRVALRALAFIRERLGSRAHTSSRR